MTTITTKRKAGRPRIGKRYLIVLDDELAAKAATIGGGRLKRSAGIRCALKAFRVPPRENS